mmetsp:Transcript_13885/g.35015  ORF Transcript_13885/g.35015 Transcript_13885/m.35015 type:complete len:238 (-) Transcript_13885:161-874(-)
MFAPIMRRLASTQAAYLSCSASPEASPEASVHSARLGGRRRRSCSARKVASSPESSWTRRESSRSSAAVSRSNCDEKSPPADDTSSSERSPPAPAEGSSAPGETEGDQRTRRALRRRSRRVRCVFRMAELAAARGCSGNRDAPDGTAPSREWAFCHADIFSFRLTSLSFVSVILVSTDVGSTMALSSDAATWASRAASLARSATSRAFWMVSDAALEPAAVPLSATSSMSFSKELLP